MKSLVIGASGQVGYHIMVALRRLGEERFGTTFSQHNYDLINLDISNRNQVFSVIKDVNPDRIFLASAMTAVDSCEFNPLVSLSLNVAGVKNVVDAIEGQGKKLVFFSTDYVFDGIRGPYYPHDICNPLNEYGKHKLAAEHYVSVNAENYLIIRTCGVFSSADKKNFANRLVESLKIGDTVKVVSDQLGSPTYAPDLATASIKAALVDRNRIIHISNNTTLSRFDFAKKIADELTARHGIKTEGLIEPIQTEEIKQEAERPKKAGLVCSTEVRSWMLSLDSAIWRFLRNIQI
jgi:dTDP-4-dehydrorhamnose reductase